MPGTPAEAHLVVFEDLVIRIQWITRSGEIVREELIVNRDGVTEVKPAPTED